MSLTKITGSVLAVTIVVGGVLAVQPLTAAASHNGTIEERRAAREAERAARDAEREAKRAAREAERAARKAEREAEKEAESANCGCSATVKFSRPDVQFNGATLSFVPRVDVAIRTRGESGGPDWSASLVYSGDASFSSEDVTAPGPVAFSGSRSIADGACGDNRYTFSGLALDPISFGGITRSLLNHREELDGVVRMESRIEGCGFDEEVRQFGFTVKEFGNLRVRGWRSAR